MDVWPLDIPGAFVFHPHVHGDARGHFAETFRADLFKESVGHPLTIAQTNTSLSRAGTIRGIHFAQLPPSQAKYVTCARGAVMDVIVDLRVGSPTYATWEGILLDDQTRTAVYVPEGCGHAFMALEDDAVVTYLCSTPYAPGREHALHPMDGGVGIQWPSAHQGRPIEPLLSAKDEAAPDLATLESSGLLATYADCEEWAKSLVEPVETD
jgi:dTDP-4-dehydrorhamnose 3,5-epimerase